MPSRPFLVAALLLVFAGCRESLLSPEGPDGATPSTEVPDATEVGFLKGPSFVGQGGAAEYKAPEDARIVQYQWYQSGPGAFQIYASPSRVVTFVAQSIGPLELEYVAFDADGVAILGGMRHVEILP